MSEKVESLKAFATLTLNRLDNTLKDLKEPEIEWRPVEEANNIRWILTHLSQQWNVGVLRTFRGDPNFKPVGWPDDYVGNKTYPLAKIIADMSKGRAALNDGLSKLTTADLVVEVQSPRGPAKRGDRLMMLLSEIAHHGGQIAYIRGAIGRRRQTDSHFLF